MIGVQKEVSLKTFNTFKVDVKSKLFAEITSVDELEELLSDSALTKEKLLIIGQGSNILFTKRFDGLVLKMTIQGISLLSEDDQNTVLKVGAGHSWNDLVAYAVENDWCGIETMAGIPGTVGGAVVGNAGAYGVETDDYLDSVEVLDISDLSMKSLKKENCGFEYRNSKFKTEFRGKYIVLSATFVLKKNPNVRLEDSKYQSIKPDLEKLNKKELTVKDVAKTMVGFRAAKLPDITKLGSAGSVFANPIVDRARLNELLAKHPDMPHLDITEVPSRDLHKLNVGWMLERIGWKGKKIGNVSTMPNHSNIVFVDGPATGKEILSFFKAMQREFRSAYKITPELEILVL